METKYKYNGYKFKIHFDLDLDDAIGFTKHIVVPFYWKYAEEDEDNDEGYHECEFEDYPKEVQEFIEENRLHVYEE